MFICQLKKLSHSKSAILLFSRNNYIVAAPNIPLKCWISCLSWKQVVDKYEINKFLHIAGSLSISFSIAGIFWHLAYQNIVSLQDPIVFRALVFGFVCFAIISWKIFEYVSLFDSEYLTYSDTIIDMICGLIGGLISMLFIRIPDYVKCV